MMSQKQYAPLSLSGEEEVDMVSMGGGAGTWGSYSAPSVSPVVGEEVKCEWLTQRELGAWGLQTAERVPRFTPLNQDYIVLVEY